jgi:hypothetical protein
LKYWCSPILIKRSAGVLSRAGSNGLGPSVHYR